MFRHSPVPPRDGEGDRRRSRWWRGPTLDEKGDPSTIRYTDGPPPRSGEDLCCAGFTLIELVVALAVFSLAALALLRLEGATLRSSAILQDQLIGQVVARNIAIEAMTDPQPPGFGSVQGVEENGGRNWRWVRIVRRGSEEKLQRIDVAVTDDNGQPAGTLTVFRLTT